MSHSDSAILPAPGPVPVRAPADARRVRQVWAALTDRSPAGRARRMAGTAFSARVLNAGLGFATQIILARWMGETSYGIYAYLWVWVLVAGGLGSLGLPVAALKLVPDYAAREDRPGLRGFLRWSRTTAMLPAVAAAGVGLAVALATTGPGFEPYRAATLLALVAVPVYVLTDVQTGIARAYDFADLGLAADYVLRPGLLLALAGLAALAGLPGTAAVVMGATLLSVVVTALVQGGVLQGRLARAVPPGPARLDRRRWSATAWPLLTVTGFTLLGGAIDVLVLQVFVGPDEIAVYFAATKIVAVASFVSYGVANTSAHRFAACAATGDRAGLTALAAETVRWTFWPTLAVAAGLAVFAGPLLSLFGPHFESGTRVVAILAVGLAAAASVGPADRALAMADQGRVTAGIFAAACLLNLVLAIALIPPFGLVGAALSTALAMAAKAAALSFAARSRLGLDMFILPGLPAAARAPAAAPDDLRAELVSVADGPDAAAWSDLAARALEPNVFFDPALVRAGSRFLPGEAGQRLVLAWRGAGDARRLVGLLPIVRPRGRHGNPFPVWRAAEHYGTLSTPLLDADRPDDTLRAMLAALRGAGQHGLLLPFLAADGPVAAALGRVAAGGIRCAELERHERAVLESPLAGADYVRATLEPRRRKEADRQRRRLADEGALAFRVAREPGDVAAALERFLDLEAAGWKGRLGTDLKHAPGSAEFIRGVARDLAPAGRFRVALLELNGTPVAAGLVAIAGRRAFYLKTTYDESFARFSPGLLLTLDLTAHLLDDPAVDGADSIAVADHPMIDRIWTARFAVASMLVSTSPGGSPLFRAAVATERLREEARRAWHARKARRAAARSTPPAPAAHPASPVQHSPRSPS